MFLRLFIHANFLFIKQLKNPIEKNNVADSYRCLCGFQTKINRKLKQTMGKHTKNLFKSFSCKLSPENHILIRYFALCVCQMIKLLFQKIYIKNIITNQELYCFSDLMKYEIKLKKEKFSRTLGTNSKNPFFSL